MPELDPLARKSYADAILERTAEQLHELLVETAGKLTPFPSFPGAFFTCAVECEPAGGAVVPEYGCIVVKEDGELYEFRMGMDFSAGDDLVAVRNEETRPIALHPRDYIVYAYNGLVALTELLLEQEEAGQQTSP